MGEIFKTVSVNVLGSPNLVDGSFNGSSAGQASYVAERSGDRPSTLEAENNVVASSFVRTLEDHSNNNSSDSGREYSEAFSLWDIMIERNSRRSQVKLK